MQTAREAMKAAVLRRATVIVGALVAAFVPLMQLIVDRDWPELSKPVLAGIVAGLLIVGLCALPPRWHLRLFLLTCVGVLTLGMAEVVASVIAGAGTASIYDWDTRCLYKPRPNSQKSYRRTPINGGQVNTVSINSQGYRGPELSTGHDRPRVIVYGDSFIEAEYSDFKDTFCEQLRGLVTKSVGKDVEIINAGANGYGPDQALLRMETELSTLRPQVVVLSVFADNDYGDLMRNKLFRLDDGGQLISNEWTRSPHCLHPGLRGRYEPTLWKLARLAIRGLQSQGGVVESYMERWRLQCEAEYDEYIIRRNSEVHDLQADHYDADIGLTPDCPSAKYKTQLFGQILQRVIQICRKRDIRLLVMIIPSPADLIENYDFCAIDHQRYPDYDKHALTNIAEDAARGLQLPYVNLYEPFAQHDPAKLFFRGGDNHWNDAGQKLAAERVAPELQRMLK